TVMSAPRRDVAVLDAGHKAATIDSGMPQVWQRPGLRYVSASDEHGKLEIAPESAAPKLGEKLRLVPGHFDPPVDPYCGDGGVWGGGVDGLWRTAAGGGRH